jgi:hypothetical protein
MAPVAGKAKRLTPEVLDQFFASAITAARRDLQRELHQGRPKVSDPRRIVWVKGACGTFLCEILGRGALGSEVEDKDLELTE